jgi:hypothetical protein
LREEQRGREEKKEKGRKKKIKADFSKLIPSPNHGC